MTTTSQLKVGDTKPEVVITMPVYNEGSLILSVINEIADTFVDYHYKILVVDDCSTDLTHKVLNSIANRVNLDIVRNSQNLGHGPSTVLGLSRALSHKPEIVLATDGDGVVAATELERLFLQLRSSDSQLLEGFREGRTDPGFRTVVSRVARLTLLAFGSRHIVDANTPVRGYKPEVLELLLARLPTNPMVPNMMISQLSRQLNLRIKIVKVVCQNSLQRGVQGTTWGARFGRLPSKKFIVFCVRAMLELFSFNLRNLYK